MESLKKTHLFHFWKIKSRSKVLVSPTTVGSLQDGSAVVLGPRKHCNMCWQSCKLNLEPLGFNIRTFIRSKARVELFLWVDVRPLAALLGWIFLFILVIFNAKLMHFLGHCTEGKSFSQGLGGCTLSFNWTVEWGPVFLFTLFYIIWKHREAIWETLYGRAEVSLLVTSSYTLL